jgi:hypothetical protein
MNNNTQEKIVYQYYLKITTKSRNEAIELLKKRNFIILHRNYNHWFNRKEKNVNLNSTSISNVIKELTKIKYKHNESEPVLSSYVKENENVFGNNIESSIEITSYIYTIVPFKKCKSLAKNYADSFLWKLKYQPNGKDAESYRKILNNYKQNKNK